jgi:cytochrome c oxidase cbb3-type subunit III
MNGCCRFANLFFIALVAAFASSGCSDSPGHPRKDSVPVDPDKVSDFAVLFQQNCSGCHGPEGRHGAALPIGDPTYLGIADDAILRRVITNGIAGTSMPSFARSAGGMLTESQVEILVRGIRQRWGKPDVFAGVTPPPYSSAEPGDSERGAEVYNIFCASCHGPAGTGGPKGSSIVDGSFLALLTDQELRTMIIVGRPDLGAPDWRNNVPGKPMSSENISDVVAWLAVQRPEFAGRPYPRGQPAGERP